MEKLHSSRPWRRKDIVGPAVMAASDYDDVFGRAPQLRQAAPFSLQLEDYFEIFGSAASVSSIPLLDLPPADDFKTVDCGAGGCRDGVDYSDVFGMFGGGVFAASYEELFPEPKRSQVSSLEGRTRGNVLTEEQDEQVLEHPLKASNEYDANLEMNQHSSVSEHSDDSSKQFMAHHRTNQEPFNDALSEKMHKSKLDAIPGYSITFDTLDPEHEMKIKSVNKGMVDRTGTQKYRLNEEQKNKATHCFFSSVKNSLVKIKSDMTPQKSNFTSLPDVSREEKHHSRSSSYHSTSSGDIPFDDGTYLQVSEISLQTRPLQGPPPSRPPPELSNKAEDLKVMFPDSRFDLEERSFLNPNVNNQLHSRNVATDINKIDESLKDISCLHNDEMDPCSAAALSIAAVIEAMEQAQARIKSAKDLMDRKCHKRYRKVSLMPKALNSKEDEASFEVEPKSCSDMKDSNNLFKKSSMISECMFAREEIRAEGKTALNHEEIKVQLPSYKKDQQLVTKDDTSNSSEMAFKIVKMPGEWKIDKNYYECIRHDIFFNTTKEIYIQGNEKKEKAGEDKVINKELKKAIEVEENHKSVEVSFCIEKLTKDDFKDPSMACKEDVNKNLVDMNEFLLKDTPSELEEALGSKQPGENQKLSDTQNDNTNDNKISESNFAHDSCLHKESANNSLYSNLVFKVGVANENCEERQLKTAEVVVSDYVDCKKKYNVSCLEPELNGSYIEVKVPNDTLLQAIFEKKTRLPEELFAYNRTNKKEVAEEYKLCSSYENETGMKHKYSYDAFSCKIENSDKAAEKDEGDGLQTNEEMHKLEENDIEKEVLQNENVLEVAEEYKLYSNYENETGRMKHKYSYDMFSCKIENSDSAVEKDEGDELQTNEETHIFEENELEQEVLQDENGLENLKISGKIKNTELEQILNSRKGSCYKDCNKKESNEAGTSLLKDEPLGALMNQELQNSEFLGPAEVSCDNRLSENITEVPVPDKFVKNQISLNSAAKISQLAEIDDSETQAILSRKESSLPVLAQNSTEVSHNQMAENHEQFSRDEEENRRKINIDRERDEEQKSKLEEELESEREKDKIALEQANYEARQQEFAEAQKRAERIAVERVTAEARQRAFVDAREKAEKASETEKASREARLRAERAAVERATEEARRRAIEKALAEKAAAGARERTTQVSSSNKDRMRKDDGIAHFKANHLKEDSVARHKFTSTNAQSHSAACSTNGHRYSDSSNNGGMVSNMRSKAGQERQQQTAERAPNAISEKNMRDLLAQREQAERDRLAESLDFVVKKWSMGKDGNLRSLLSTLQYILASESGWQPISQTDLINAPAVKKAYRKATLCVHPDKLQQRGATIQQKYICEKVFDLLKEAWDKFNSEER